MYSLASSVLNSSVPRVSKKCRRELNLPFRKAWFHVSSVYPLSLRITKEEWRQRYNVEVDRTLALTNLADDYDTTCKIRHYIAVVEASGAVDENTAIWITWAKAKADWYDPFFGKRQHEKGAEVKELKYKGYRW